MPEFTSVNEQVPPTVPSSVPPVAELPTSSRLWLIFILVFFGIVFLVTGLVIVVALRSSVPSKPLLTTSVATSTQTAFGYRVANDQAMAKGDYFIPSTTWSPGSDRFFLTRSGPETEIGLPAYVTYDVVNVHQGTLLPSGVEAGIVDPELVWQRNDTLATGYGSLLRVGDTGIKIEINSRLSPPGYDVFKQITYTNPNTHNIERSVDRLTFSPDGSMAAFFSLYGSDRPGAEYGYKLFLISQGATSSADIKNFGNVQSGVESSNPPVEWSKNGKLIIVGQNEVFDAEKGTAILAALDPYHRRLTRLSPDETKALVIENFQDRTDQQDYRHETVRVFVKDFVTFQETLLYVGDGSERWMYDIDGSWSPDGTHVIFNATHALWLGDATTGETKQLTSEEKNYYYPRWSPDGKKIVSVVNDPPEVRMIELVRNEKSLPVK